MENSWQVKYSSTLSSSSTSHHQRSQMGVNAGHSLYPHFGQDRRPLHGEYQGHTLPNITNLSSDRPVQADNSYVSLLSGSSSSVLQSDFHELLNPKLITTSSKLRSGDGSFNVSAGSGVPLSSTGLLPENLSSHNMKNGAEYGVAVSPIRAVSSHSSSYSVLLDNCQSVGSWAPLASAGLLSENLSNQNVRNRTEIFSVVSSRPVGEWCGTSPLSGGDLRSADIRRLEVNSSPSTLPSTSKSACPRVFCLGKSGHLLLCDTGLIGILCSCHSHNMSVSKFCEHSGLRDINPGEAVRMDSGETIAQWRKLYFQRFGIRVPDDHSGWDWPEGISSAAGVRKSSGSIPSMSIDSNLAHPGALPANFMMPGLPLGSISLPDNDHVGQSRNLHERKQRNASAVTDNQTARCPISSCSTNRGYPCLHNTMGSTVNIGNSSENQFSLRNHGKNSDIGRIKNPRDNVIIDKDNASSNVELRLGQPYHQSHSLGNPVLSVVGSKGLDRRVEPLKSLFSEQMILNAKCGEKESRQYRFRAAVHSDATTMRGHSQLNLENKVLGHKTTISADRLEGLMGDMANNSVHPLKHLNGPPPVGSLSLKVRDNLATMNMPKKLSFNTHTANCDLVGGLGNGCNNTKKELNVSELSLFQLRDKGKAIRCISDASNVGTSLIHKVQKQIENPSSLSGVVGGSFERSLSAAHDKIALSSQLPNVPLNAFSARNPSGNSEKVFCIGSGGHTDQMFFRSTGPPKCPVQVLPSKPISMNLPTSYSISTPAVTQATSKQDSPGVIPYFLDESMRLLALGQIVELSKQQQELSILGVNQKHRRFGDSQNVNIRHSSVNLSTSAEHKNVHNPSCSLDASDVAVKSFSRGFTDRINSSIETLAPSTGLNACCNTSKSAQGISSSRGTDVQRRCFHDSVMNDCPTLRSEMIISQLNGHENCCCSRAPYTHFHCSHNRATNATRLVGNCDSAAGSCPNTFREWMRGPNREASKAVALESVETDFLPKAETISSAQGRLIEGQLRRNGVGPVPQWRDVPSKLQRVCDVSADILNSKEQDEGQVGYGVGDTSAKCYNGGLQVDDSLKNQEMSNVSSGCSAPIVTHASNDVNNMDSSIVDAEDGGYASYSAVDEGSGIDNDKCWSSDDSLESERSAEFTGSNRTDFKKQGSCRSITNQSSRSLLQELKLLDFLTWKKGRNQIPNELTTSEKTDHLENFIRDTEAGERKKPMKSKFQDVSYLNTSPTIHCNGPKDTGTSHEASRCSKDLPKHLPVIPKHYSSGTSSHTNSNSGAHSLSLAEAPSRQRDLYALYNDRAVEDDYRTGFGGNGNCCETIEASGRKKCTYKTLRHFQTPETPDADADSSPNFNSVGYMKASSGQPSSISYKKDRPVVCGIYGEISGANLEGDNSKPVKYLSLSQIIKSTKKCVLKKSKPRLISSSELKNTRHGDTNSSGDKFLSLKKLEENGSHSPSFYDKIDVDLYEEETKRACSDDDKWFAHGSSMLEKEKDCQSEKDNIQVQLKPKCKEIRKRSLYELTLEGNTSRNICSPPITKSKCIRKEKMRKVLHSAEATQCHNHSSCNVDTEKSIQKQQCFSNVDSDAICCVCGSLNQDDLNCILKCSRCLIKVHQACYGVSRVPKGRWSCRPCTASAKDIVCVLCGYGGGALTRALGSRAIVKSLLKAWNIESEDQPKNKISPFETSANTSGVLSSFGSVINGNSSSVLKPIHMEPLNAGEIKMDEQNQEGFTQSTPSDVGNLKKVHNSITAGISDPSARQWIHMVCGLWTPTTRCPNVYTMGAFDVSDTLHPGSDVICSICKRPGGSSIQCRVLNCSVRFHPWCAHQKGLLQSEVEGVDNESVGFYGRCVSHATFPMWDSDTDNMDVQTNCSREEFTSARTEGYKGRKRDGVSQNLYGQSNRKKGCLVPQEQLNAWTHINGQKWTQGLPKLPISDVEYDCRKEYARYKHAKGWKRLVVYKSGIHALGLYTSQFISRGEMVVEYVGEIVGTRVVDKRENEYLSGRKLQYESACYFFRVDKEHTIDATCKGGIARFVNHSCWPNCVAKVISVRNEKKVVFFADRDIYPGEEITYDYHFNHEDEGKKIPCFCNSKNCRRYMN